MSTPIRPLSFTETGRQSPFRRQNSASPATVRASTPTSSPTKTTYIRSGSLSPEKQSPFVRRPSQISHTSDRPTSPFARPSSSLSIPQSPSRQASTSSLLSRSEDVPQSPRPLPTPSRRITPPEATPEPSTPTLRKTSYEVTSPSALDGPVVDSPTSTAPSQAILRPTAPRTTTSSTLATVRPPPTFANHSAHKLAPAPKLNGHTTSSGGGFTHIPPPLLRSMRESFEVLDSGNTGTITSASVTSMLEQMNLAHDPATLLDFFPPNQPTNFNLARYLDLLSGPLADLSHPDELTAAFEAFDVDDSGQIDVMQLRDALLHTAPEPGEEMVRLSEREVDGILSEFSSRRAFGAKGLNAAKGKGEVFRYRDFMAGIAGGSAGAEDGIAVA